MIAFGVSRLLATVLAGAAAAVPAAPVPARQQVVDVAAAALFARHGRGIEARPLDEAMPALDPPAGVLGLRARVPEGASLARRLVVNVDISVDGRHWRTEPVWFAVQAWRDVWVARVPLAAGQLASAANLVVERREAAASISPPLPASLPLDGLRLRQALPAGAVLTAAAVEPRPAVARQQSIEVRVSAGGIELQTTGVALADARIGELVKVLNPASKESFTARVLADGLVAAGGR